jgi:CubicO group peptidase (beta-lactamase class C family)
MDQHNIPAVSLMVQLGDVRWTEAFGYTDVENAVRAKVNSVYRLASVSKVFTATAVMQLVERGKIELDAPIQRYVREYPEKAHVVTVRQLLNHTSGLRHYRSDDDEADPEVNNTRRFSTLAEAVAQFSQDPLQQEPGAKLLYSTHAYTLLGRAVEMAAGTTFDEYMREHIFRPAGLTQTRIDSVREIISMRVKGYQASRTGVLENAPLSDTSNRIPGGGFVSTVEDLTRFAAAVQDGTLIRRDSFARMTVPDVLPGGEPNLVGLGWLVGGSVGRTDAIWHAGNQYGATSMLYLLPDKHLSIAILTNMGAQGPAVIALTRAIVESLLPHAIGR